VLATLASLGHGLVIKHGLEHQHQISRQAPPWSLYWLVVPGTLNGSGHGLVIRHGIEHQHQISRQAPFWCCWPVVLAMLAHSALLQLFIQLIPQGRSG
jgi:hypothetical protein